LTGSASSKYVLSQPPTSTPLAANITGAPVTIEFGLTPDDKPYDGTTTATLSSNNVVLVGVLPADAGNVALSTNGYTANFATAAVGNGIQVAVSGLTLTGTAAGNYSLTQPSLFANITCPVITASPSGSASVCPGNPAIITVVVVGGIAKYSVTLDNGGGTQVGASPLQFLVSPVTTTTYSISSGTDDAGCPISGNGTVTITVNTPPTAVPDTLGTVKNKAVSAPVTQLLANDSSPIAGLLSIISVTSPSVNHGTVTLVGGLVTYTPANNFTGPDSFTYTLSDGRCTAQGAVMVTVNDSDLPSMNEIAITGTPPNVTLLFAGVPGQVYVVQWASAASGLWTDFADGTQTADATGLIQYTDSTQPPPPTRFFRTRVGP
jgi:hypothetical protein